VTNKGIIEAQKILVTVKIVIEGFVK